MGMLAAWILTASAALLGLAIAWRLVVALLSVFRRSQELRDAD